jgi:Fe-S-cluster-containing dehydrogenase component
MDALIQLCVHRPHTPRLDVCAVTGLWAEWGGVVGCRYLDNNVITGTLPTELGTMDALNRLCVHRPHTPRLDVCAVTGLWAEWGGVVGCRDLSSNIFTGTLPTELGTMDALTRLCVHRPHPPPQTG